MIIDNITIPDDFFYSNVSDNQKQIIKIKWIIKQSVDNSEEPKQSVFRALVDVVNLSSDRICEIYYKEIKTACKL